MSVRIAQSRFDGASEHWALAWLPLVRLAPTFAVVALAAACAGCGSIGTGDPASGKASYSAPPPTPTLAAAEKPVTVAHGTPYAADDVLAALAASGSRVPPDSAPVRWRLRSPTPSPPASRPTTGSRTRS